jgi:hypothetical protein
MPLTPFVEDSRLLRGLGMFGSLRGMVVGMVLVAGASAYAVIDRDVNFKAAKASAVMIDRKCDFTETTTEEGHTVARGVTDSCNSTDEWQTVKEKRSKVVSGRAAVQVSYVAPQDGAQHFGELRFDGRDDEFYQLKAGDEIDILVSNDDLSKIRKA